MTQWSTRSQSQSVFFPEELADASVNTPPPHPLPGENASKRWLTHSTTCAGGGVPPPHQLDTPATPITPSCTVAPNQRTGLQPPKASAIASSNPYTPLGEDAELKPTEDAVPPQGSNDPRAPAHGWDSFVSSLDVTARQELGVVDDILISYANFAGDAFSMFDVESVRVMDQIIAMEVSLEYDHNEVVQTRGSLSKLEELVLAKATGISDIKTMMRENAATMRENISNVAALRDIVDDTSTQVKTMAEALREVTETANNAFCLASGAQPTIIGHGVKLDALVDDVSRMSSDIDGLRAFYASPTDHTNQLAQLEGTVS